MLVRPKNNPEVIPIEYYFNVLKARIKKRRTNATKRISKDIIAAFTEMTPAKVIPFIAPSFHYHRINLDRADYMKGKQLPRKLGKRTGAVAKQQLGFESKKVKLEFSDDEDETRIKLD